MKKKIFLFLCASIFFANATELSVAAAATKVKAFRPLTTINANNSFRAGTLNEPLFPFSNGGVWDSVSERMLYIGAAHQVPLRFIGYVASSNEWRVYPMPLGFTGVSHSYDQQTLDTAGILYYIQWSNSMMYLFNTRTNKWIDSISGATGSFGTLDYFPEKNGLLRVVSGAVRFFNIGTRTWQSISTRTMGSMHNLAQYTHSEKCIYFGGGDGNRSFYRIDTNFQITTLQPLPFDLGVNNGHITADPVTGTLIVMKTDSLYSYNSSLDTWSAICKSVISNISIGYSAVVPISTYGVIAIMSAASWPVLLFRYANSISVEQIGINTNQTSNMLLLSPNPFTKKLNIISSGIKSGTRLSIRITNLNGTLIRTLYNENCHTGDQPLKVTWDGKDSKGKFMSKGIYLALLENGNKRESRAIVLE